MFLIDVGSFCWCTWRLSMCTQTAHFVTIFRPQAQAFSKYATRVLIMFGDNTIVIFKNLRYNRALLYLYRIGIVYDPPPSNSFRQNLSENFFGDLKFEYFYYPKYQGSIVVKQSTKYGECIPSNSKFQTQIFFERVGVENSKKIIWNFECEGVFSFLKKTQRNYFKLWVRGGVLSSNEN